MFGITLLCERRNDIKSTTKTRNFCLRFAAAAAVCVCVLKYVLMSSLKSVSHSTSLGTDERHTTFGTIDLRHTECIRVNVPK